MKTALITGASGGIGQALVKKFILEGYFVIAQYNTGKDKMIQIENELDRLGLSGYLSFFQADFSDSNAVNSFIEFVKKNFKHIDVLVNNAGAELYKQITDTTEQEWDKLFSINMKSAYQLSNLCLESMISRKGGKIINVSSIWGINGASMEVAYSATKSAMIGYTKALAKEVAPSNITVNCVCPGVIETKMNGRFNEQEMKELIEATPLGRLGTPSEVAELVYFLASDKAHFITGGVFTIDGGFSL